MTDLVRMVGVFSAFVVLVAGCLLALLALLGGVYWRLGRP
jgi:hypothetical protein